MAQTVIICMIFAIVRTHLFLDEILQIFIKKKDMHMFLIVNTLGVCKITFEVDGLTSK